MSLAIHLNTPARSMFWNPTEEQSASRPHVHRSPALAPRAPQHSAAAAPAACASLLWPPSLRMRIHSHHRCCWRVYIFCSLFVHVRYHKLRGVRQSDTSHRYLIISTLRFQYLGFIQRFCQTHTHLWCPLFTFYYYLKICLPASSCWFSTKIQYLHP